jgi:hypothetical protein
MHLTENENGLPPVMDTQAAMKYLAIGRTKFFELVKAGLIERKHIGRKALYTRRSLDEFLASLKVG